MQGYIHVTIKDDIIELMGEEFPLGALTVSLLNTPPETFKEMGMELMRVEQLADVSRENHYFYRKILKVEDSRKLKYKLEDGISKPNYEGWVEIHKSICRMNELLRTIKVCEVILGPIDANLVEEFKDLDFESKEYDFKWIWYLELVDLTMGFVEDAVAAYKTFSNLVKRLLPGLKKFDPNHLAAAYTMLLTVPELAWMISSPFDTDKCPYTMEDYMIMQYFPMQKDNGEFIIAEYFKMDSLQAVIKTDMLRGFMKGHYPKCCEHCGRYFLMTKAYRTKFCDMPSPENPKRTCNQMAYAKKKVKEENSDNPKYHSYRRCIKRIEKACQRGTITEKQKELLLSKAEELYTEAMMSPEYSNEEFEAILQSKNLYKSCGIDIPRRKGRPKKEEDND